MFSNGMAHGAVKSWVMEITKAESNIVMYKSDRKNAKGNPRNETVGEEWNETELEEWVWEVNFLKRDVCRRSVWHFLII